MPDADPRVTTHAPPRPTPYAPRPLPLTRPTDGTGVGTGGEAALNHPNLLVTLEHGARLNLMQQYVGEGAYFTNALSRVHLGDESHLTHSYAAAPAPTRGHTSPPPTPLPPPR